MFSIAIRLNWQSVAYLMLEYGFNLSIAIIDCFNHKKFNYVYTLLMRRQDLATFKLKNSEGQNLVHLFATHSQEINKELYEKILNKLVEKKIDFNVVDKNGRSALHFATQSGHLSLIGTLLEQGCKVGLPDKNNQTPLALYLMNSPSLNRFKEIVALFL